MRYAEEAVGQRMLQNEKHQILPQIETNEFQKILDQITSKYESISREDLEQQLHLILLEHAFSDNPYPYEKDKVALALWEYAKFFSTQTEMEQMTACSLRLQITAYESVDSDTLENVQFLNLIEEAVLRLVEKERLVLSLYYEQSLTHNNIAEILKVSGARVSQIHQKAIDKIKIFLYQKKVM